MMKTFEESLTAWIDDSLESKEQAAFERTLAARPDAAALRGEKDDVARLRALLRAHLPAMSPVLGQNADFFNHQLRERIQSETRSAEIADAARPARPWLTALFGGGKKAVPARLLAAGAACLLVAAAGIYRLIPARSSAPAHPPEVALISPRSSSASLGSTQQRQDATTNLTSTGTMSSPPPRSPASVEADGSIRMANVDSSRKNDPQLADIMNARVPEGTPTSATALHFEDQNADVLWLDGLEYQPDTPGTAANGVENAPTPVTEKQP